VGNDEAGLTVDEIARNYPTVSREIISGILAYVAANRLQAVS
jgi:uncharacterized protein (DUF433 family)